MEPDPKLLAALLMKLPPTVPIDLRTGKPATEPPPGANVINPYAVSPGYTMNPNPDWGKLGTKNETITPKKSW